MNTNAIRDVATKARRQLMEGVERRCLLYDVREGAQRDLDTVGGRVLSASERQQRQRLLQMLDELRADGKPGSGHAALVEQAAYTWFNRLFAIRFMELNDRLPSHVRMLSAQDGSFAPECLREALDLPLATLDRDEAARLVAEGDDEGLFRIILLAQCAELAECMPDVFEQVGSAMELLLPDGLLAKDGVVESLVTGVPEGDWHEGVEIVGWAYQYYVLERHDEVFAAYKKKIKAKPSDIAPATQLFTPEWIVKYLTENSLGRLWVLNNQDSTLIDAMEYYVKPPANAHKSYRKISSPEDISFVDPACGSGHFLCYAFDLLARMYEERGYRGRDIAKLILERNLTGFEIDRRAAALTSFSLTMKACEWDRRFLTRGIKPNVICMESTSFSPEEQLIFGASVERQGLLLEQLSHLGEIGSLWIPEKDDFGAVDLWLKASQGSSSLFGVTATEKLLRCKCRIEALMNTYDCVVTNPPYMGSGNMGEYLAKWIRAHYEDEKSDLCTCFMTRCLRFAKPSGYAATITSDTCMYLKSFEKLRAKILNSTTILTFIDTRGSNAHPDVFDANAGWVLLNDSRDTSYRGTFFKLNQRIDEKSDALRCAVTSDSASYAFNTSIERLRAIPGQPIAYWASDAILAAFRENPGVGQLMPVHSGVRTGENDRFLRLWWEIPANEFTANASSPIDSIASGKKWFPCNKGGGFRKWFGNNEYVIDWYNDGEAIRNHPGSDISPTRRMDWLFSSGLTWGTISTGAFSMRYSPQGFMYETKGAALLPSATDQMSVLGFMNSTVVDAFQGIMSPTIDYHEGPLRRIPLSPKVLRDDQLPSLSGECVALARQDYSTSEASWEFTVHPLVRGNRISSAYGLWSVECKDRFEALKTNEERINVIIARIYHMEGEVPIEVEDDKVSVRRADLSRDVRSLLSYAVGCMFGRYSLDKPGLVLANQGDGMTEYLAQVPHPRYLPDDDGILPITDDEYFDDDIVAMLCEWLRKAYGPDTLEENLRFIADALGGTGAPRKVIRDYFMNQFFVDHSSSYSAQSAGKRPVYWLIDSGKLGGFRALVYMHRYTPDLLARVRTDYVHERQERYRSRISELEEQREGASRRELSAIDKELKLLRAQLDEVTKFEERLHHLADQMIEIDLDDGFKVNYAKFADVMAKVK